MTMVILPWSHQGFTHCHTSTCLKALVSKNVKGPLPDWACGPWSPVSCGVWP